MKFIGKHIPLIGILLLTIFVGAAAGLYFDVPARLQQKSKKEIIDQQYTCPMHPEVVSAKPANCSKCGMALIAAAESNSGHDRCESSGQNQHGCCAKKSTTESAADLRLPPGHPPIPGWTIETTPEREPASNVVEHSSH